MRQAKRIRPAVGDLHGPRPMGRELVEEGLASSFAPLKIVIHLRTCRHVDVGGSESCRLDASITDADNEEN
ncbi:hypothetical protein [Streptomyces sp. NPDC005209]|uniref:hypothetical protein n=1 Tax=Streptomyces sp. NPDC005209 TaxID=3156715 RepID=UPI0033B5469A